MTACINLNDTRARAPDGGRNAQPDTLCRGVVPISVLLCAARLVATAELMIVLQSLIDRGLYKQQLQKYFDVFDATNILVLTSETLWVRNGSHDAVQLVSSNFGAHVLCVCFPSGNRGLFSIAELPRTVVTNSATKVNE